MAVAGKITVDTEVRGAGFTSGLNNAGKEVKAWAGQMQSAFQGVGQAVVGGGIAGLGSLAPMLAGAAQGAEDFATKLRTGKDVSDKLVSNLTASVPIVGQFAKVGDAIYEIVSHEKAAREEAEHIAAASKEITASFRETAKIMATMGQYGFAKQLASVKPDSDASLSDLHDKREKLQNEVGEEREKLSHWYAPTRWFHNTQAEAELQNKETAIKQYTLKETAVLKKALQDKKDIQDAEAESQRQFNREAENRLAASQAALREKVLRRMGQPVESAIVAIQERRRAELDAINESVSEHSLKLAGITDEEKNQRLQKAADARQQVEQETADSVAELRQEQDRKAFEDEIANANKLKEIQASANIEHLKMVDEHNNALAEKNGTAARSHLAARAQIEEDFRKQTEEIAKKWREEKHAGRSGADADQNYFAQRGSAEDERKNKLNLLGEKSTDETFKNQQALLKEQRRLWEEAGEPADKYAAHLQDINEQFEKLHDNRLRNQELKHLNDETYHELLKKNPDHHTKVELYGRTQKFDTVVDHSGREAAAEQLREMQKQGRMHEDWDVWFRDIWQKFTKDVLPQEINI